MHHTDVLIVGAGPAGLAAAVAAAESGCAVTVLDAGARPGGQFWRHRAGACPPALAGMLTGAWERVDYRPHSPVWFAEPDGTLHVTSGGTFRGPFRGRQLIVATGAYDRTLPFPGWDLPGVVTAGGAQALLKGDGVLIGARVLVAGTGPFLLPVATGLAAGGAQVTGVLEASHATRIAGRYLRDLPAAAGKLGEAAGYGKAMLSRRIRYRTGWMVIAASGDHRVRRATVAAVDRRGTIRPGTEREIECDAIGYGYGFTPQLELPLALGCATAVDGDQSLVVTVDEAQRTSAPGVLAAGEVTGVGGADLALVEGQLAGYAAAQALGRQAPAVTALLAKRGKLRRFAAALAAAHPMPWRGGSAWASWCDPETLVCRCERVPLSAVTHAVEQLGAVDARAVKLLTRAGMGWCQGRVCGTAVAACLNLPLSEGLLMPYARRPLAQPVSLGELAD